MYWFLCAGDKLTDEECDQLFQGMEDAQGNINYEGTSLLYTCNSPKKTNLHFQILGYYTPSKQSYFWYIAVLLSVLVF